MVINTRTKEDIGANVADQRQNPRQNILSTVEGQVKQLFVGAGSAAETLDAASTPTIDASLIETVSLADCSGGSIAINLPDASSHFTESHLGGDGFLKIIKLITSPIPGANVAVINGNGFTTVTLSAVTGNLSATFMWQDGTWANLCQTVPTTVSPGVGSSSIVSGNGVITPIAVGEFCMLQQVSGVITFPADPTTLVSGTMIANRCWVAPQSCKMQNFTAWESNPLTNTGNAWTLSVRVNGAGSVSYPKIVFPRNIPAPNFIADNVNSVVLARGDCVCLEVNVIDTGDGAPTQNLEAGWGVECVKT